MSLEEFKQRIKTWNPLPVSLNQGDSLSLLTIRGGHIVLVALFFCKRKEK